MLQRRTATPYRSSIALLSSLLSVACSTQPAPSVAGPVPRRVPDVAPAKPAVSATPSGSQATRAERTRAFALPSWGAFDSAVARGTRTHTGHPGPAYWQQHAEYHLAAELNQVSKRLTGYGTVVYHNNSPDTLETLYFQAYGNLFAPDAKRNTQLLASLGGINFTRVAVEGSSLDSTALGAGWTVSGTIMTLRLAKPLLPGTSVELAFAWNLRVPPDAPRGGQDRETYILSYWYPQVAVYDDVNGWQTDQYLGNAEFYMGYGDYDVALTVPEGWLVASTGTLQNPDEVLSDETRARLARARAGGAVVSVVGAGDRGAGKATAKGSGGKLTWRFKAENVRDVTWATSSLYLWDATTASVGDRRGTGVPDSTMIYSFYRPDQRRNGWGESATYAAHAISIFSRVLWPYPYPHMTVVDGPASCGGMEFPMMTCIGGDWNVRTLFDVEAHEIAHMWFPMQVGSDEKRYAWMDEGMAQYFQSVAIDAQFPDADDVGENRRNYVGAARFGKETEMMRYGDKYPDYNAYGIASYFKPATVLVALGGVIGDSTLMQGLREYGRRWTDRHPMPNDFWNTMNQVSGQDLDWFWRTWYYETWKLDQAIDDVVRASPDTLTVTLESRGRAPMPVLLVAYGAGGAITSLVVPVDVWFQGEKKVTVQLAVPKDFTRLEIDPAQRFPDADRSNQTWPRR
jgi:hypothetical protein